MMPNPTTNRADRQQALPAATLAAEPLRGLHAALPLMAHLRPVAMSAPCRLSGVNRTRCAHYEISRS
jgi:hypothetical protein